MSENKPLTMLVPALRAECQPRFEHCAGVLLDNGYGLEIMVHKGTWQVQTPLYMVMNRAVVGFIARCDDVAISAVHAGEGKWHTSDKRILDVNQMNAFCESQNTYVVWRMWYPIERMLSDPFIPDDPGIEQEKKKKRSISFCMIRRGDSAGVRYECKAKNCWKPERLDYRGREDAIQRIMKNWKKVSNILLSNKEGVYVMQPTHRKGWKQKSLLEWSGLTKEKIPLRLFYHLVEALKDHIESDERTKNSREEKIYIYYEHSNFLHCTNCM